MTLELSRLSERKLIKSGFLIEKVGITFYRFSENPKIPAGNAEQKVGITFFSETDKKSFFCEKVIKLFKPLMRYAQKSSSVNVSCKELSRLFTELISEKNREILGNPQKVIPTFL